MTPMAATQTAFLYLLRFLGGFAVARRITRKRLRILCYHGFSIGDEFRILPFLFMRSTTFERRLQILKRRSIPVISLDNAVKHLRDNRISNAETVITLDDGWASNLTIALPILEKYRFPACVYVTTEHLQAGAEAFNVALYYMMRKSSHASLTLIGIHPAIDGVYDLSDPEDATARLIRLAEPVISLAERQAVLRPIARALGINADEIFENGRFTFLNAAEMKLLSQRGVDIELHTHTHHLPTESFDDVASEITRNRGALEQLTGKPARHFCYPSGMHNPVHPGWLQRLGIESATTCDPGLNTAETPTMLLRRFLDSDETPDIFFEAEICGVRDLLKDVRSRFRAVFS